MSGSHEKFADPSDGNGISLQDLEQLKQLNLIALYEQLREIIGSPPKLSPEILQRLGEQASRYAMRDVDLSSLLSDVDENPHSFENSATHLDGLTGIGELFNVSFTRSRLELGDDVKGAMVPSDFNPKSSGPAGGFYIEQHRQRQAEFDAIYRRCLILELGKAATAAGVVSPEGSQQAHAEARQRAERIWRELYRESADEEA